ncbi:interleukin-23 subunit alpha [Cuculus canorus]|uniref:interleukin-23 subunit alpha n=1 Tax=Cuculus canorus TaxID=55661 RepID=UPI0023AAEFD8|nr:interleukin-23 subunit alpha [Cuculus canorus]
MAPLRLLRLCLCLAALLPPPPAVPAPVPAPRTDWAACRNLSQELSRRLAALKEPHRDLEGTQLSEEDPNNWPPRIRCSDACDPSTLDTNNTRCLRRILQGLQHYRDLLGSDITDRNLRPLEAVMDQLLGLVQQEHGRAPQHPLAPTGAWSHPLLRRLALQRLQSFTAIMGRVFTHSASVR